MATAYIVPRRAREDGLPGGRVLVLDKDPAVARALAHALAEEHDVAAITSARETLAHLRSRTRYDLILCDVLLDEMSGPEFLSELEHISHDAAERVVFTTSATLLRACRAADGRDIPCLRKPLDLDEVRSMIRLPPSDAA